MKKGNKKTSEWQILVKEKKKKQENENEIWDNKKHTGTKNQRNEKT